MTYVYDILLNFEKEFFDFFEWNSDDDIMHIKKIPIFRVTNKEFYLFRDCSIRFHKSFMDKIFNKTERFSREKNKIAYAFLVSNGHETMALKLNKNGINVYKSSLLLDEEDEVTDIGFNNKEVIIGYDVLEDNREVCFKTRKEKELEKYLNNYIDNLYKNKENAKLQFLYLDCFNTREKDIKKIYEALKFEVFNGSKNVDKLSDFFKIIEQK